MRKTENITTHERIITHISKTNNENNRKHKHTWNNNEKAQGHIGNTSETHKQKHKGNIKA